MLLRKCNFPLAATHHISIFSTTVSSCVDSSSQGSLPPLFEQRVVGHVQVFNLHLVIIDTYGGQGAGHFLLLEEKKQHVELEPGTLLPSCGHTL